MNNLIDAAAHWTASMVAMILLAFCALLIWRHQRRLAALQTQLDRHNQAISTLEAAHESLLVRYMNLPRSRRSRKALNSSSPWSGPFEEKITSPIAPEQPDEKPNRPDVQHLIA
jgi:hypothetical protein